MLFLQNISRMCWTTETLPGEVTCSLFEICLGKQNELYISESPIQLTGHGELHFIVRLC